MEVADAAAHDGPFRKDQHVPEDGRRRSPGQLVRRGPAHLVAHGGWVGSGEPWQAPFEQLSRRWRRVTYDHRGTGGSRQRADAITAQVLIDDLFRVLDARRIDRCVLAGESSGAVIAPAAPRPRGA
jgi:pimeloyl-ACP methyl ester carboxylesterase